MAWGVAIDTPEYTLCARFAGPEEEEGAALGRWPQLAELAPDWLHRLDPDGQASPWVQVARRRRGRTSGAGTQALTRPLPGIQAANRGTNALGRGTGRLADGALEEAPKALAPLGWPQPPALPLLDRWEGALVGLALGDAFGFPAEGLSPEEVLMTYGGPLDMPVGRLGRRHRWPAGQVTRHTQLSLVLGESFVAAEGLHLDDFAARLVRWLPRALRPGKATQEAVEALAKGSHWSHSGTPSAGISGALRGMVLALPLWQDPAALRQAAIAQCWPTHRAPEAMAASAMLSAALAGALVAEAEVFHPKPWLAHVQRAVQGMAPAAAERLALVASLLEVDQAPEEGMAQLRCGGFALECGGAALYAFAKCHAAPAAALRLAANAGHDAAATSAIVGALVGALHGASGLPSGWVSALPLSTAMRELAQAFWAQGQGT
jgi:ADP-ribosyl-[dinitrogen reductase] hydrolase